MELFEDPVLRAQYNKNKFRVKRWESSFMEKYGRKPNKNDIKEADASIRAAYKIYWKLKTRALEETLMDITFCDDVQSNISNAPLGEAPGNPRQERSPEKAKSPDKTKSPDKAKRNAENIDPHDSGKHPAEAGNSSGHSDAANVQGVWGSHLSKEQAAPKKQLLIGRSTSFQLSRNKFESSAFVKRNPRKSLSAAKLKPGPERGAASDPTSVDAQSDADSKDGFDVATRVTSGETLFGDSVRVTFEGSKLGVSRPVSAVQQLVEGRATAVNRNLNPGWLDRCARDGNLDVAAINPQRLSGTSDSGVESMESSLHSPKDAAPAVISAAPSRVSDEEDYICNSDSEEERRNKRIRNFKRHLGEQDCRPAKRRCVEIESATQPGGTTDSNTRNLTPDADARLNLLLRSRNETDKNINLLESTGRVDASSESRTRNVASDTADARSSGITDDEVASRNTRYTETKSDSATTSTIATSKAPVSQENTSTRDGKAVKRSTSRRRARRRLSPDNSDREEEKSKKSRTKAKAGAVKNSTGRRDRRKATSSEERPNAVRKSTRRKNLVSYDEEQSSDSERRKIPIYSVETLRATPRFAVRPAAGGDLIARFSQSVDGEKSDDVSSASSGPSAARKKLEKKIAAGTLNDNYVRINLKKKVFVRGKKNFNLAKYKRNQWKQKKKDLASGESSLDAADLMDKNGATCFKCGESGHFAKNCSATKGDALLPLEEVDESSSSFPTLEEAEKMASVSAVVAHGHRIDRLPEKPSLSAATTSRKNKQEEREEDAANLSSDDFADFIEGNESTFGHKIPQELLSRLLPPETEAVSPLYPANADGTLVETPTEVFETLRMFGHESFRAGQEKAVMRILSGQSTLVTLSTGSGKSLCYQLPAYLYSRHSRCITLVISPLVSLMDDQVTGVPLFLSAACLHTGQTPKVRERVMRSVKDGTVNILLVSPEAVVAGEKSTGFGALLRQLPPIAFACIDEAHCISQWSHNFRPSYLMVCRVLKEKLRVRTVLGLTATATRATAESIAKHLDLHDGITGVISDVPLPRNLMLTVSTDENKDQALIALLKSERFRDCDSVIVYCTRRDECIRIAGLLRISLQDPQNPEKPNAKVSAIAEAYHAGMTAYKRKVVQKKFMSGEIKIVVATVAFGMGINKPDIRAVIHYNMPGTFEGYVQEIGRAGRDGLPAHCHLFLNPGENSDKWELRRHIHANGVDRHTIRHLLQRIFIPCSCARINAGRNSGRRCPGHEVALPIDETVQALDITEEIISTLLCYLELHPKRFVTVLSSVYVRARVSSYHGPQALKQAAQSSPPLAMAIALDMKRGISHENSNLIEFPVVDVASAIGWDSGVVKSHLKNLEWTTAADGRTKRSAISVHYDKLGLRVRAPGDLTDTELDEALDALIARTRSQESSCLQQLELIASTLGGISARSVEQCSVWDENVTKKSEELKDIIRDYFKSESPLKSVDIDSADKVNEQQIAADVRSMIMCYRDTSFTGRAVARIFHGIQSPNYPALIWGRCRFWRAHLAADFNVICRIATREILALR